MFTGIITHVLQIGWHQLGHNWQADPNTCEPPHTVSGVAF